MTVRCEVLKDWTLDELKQELLIWLGVELGKTQLYKWLSYALIVKGPSYSNRDRKKLLAFASLMKRYRNLEMARAKLAEHIQEHPEEYPDE